MSALFGKARKAWRAEEAAFCLVVELSSFGADLLVDEEQVEGQSEFVGESRLSGAGETGVLAGVHA